MKKYKYKQLKAERYWNGWRTFYVHDNGNKELICAFCLTKRDALDCGKANVDYMNGKEIKI